VVSGQVDTHFPGCHPEDAEDPRQVANGYEPQETEDCWHCGTPVTLGCHCADCLASADYVPPTATYHCPACSRWWAWMTGLNITTITFGADEPGPEPVSPKTESGV
jgi:hypothetical protein